MKAREELAVIGEELSRARYRAQQLWEELDGGDEADQRIAPLVNALLEAIAAASRIKAIALGVSEEWDVLGD